MVNSQAILFIIFLIIGFIIGILFDFFRILRKSFKTGIIITSIEDIIFWLLTGIIILYSVFIFNNGIIRGYMFLSILIGVLFYMITLSSMIITMNVLIINFLRKILQILINFILIPIKIIFRPIKKLFGKIINTLLKKFKKISKNNEIKEGF